MNRHIAIIGAGAWGIALAQHFANKGDAVTLWSRATAAPGSRRLPRLPNVTLHDAIEVSDTFPTTADHTLFATPVMALRAVSAQFSPSGIVVACCKGLEEGSNAFPADILAQTCRNCDVAVLSGPNFAHEVAAGLPAAATLAATSMKTAQHVAAALSSPQFRLYASDDLMGVQLAGAAKNVFAIAAGIAVGAGMGENARAALITRGLAELRRLNTALGGREATLLGLSGVGDLILTCTGASSRNFRYGVALGSQKESAAACQDPTDAIVEGRNTAPTLLALAKKHNVETPIVEAVMRLQTGQISVSQAMSKLLSRPLAAE